MSGHSKWHSIKHKKGAADAKRGKIFTRHAKLITIAARAGGDVEMNPSLRVAIANAKADNVPNANIEKAVKKGSGEDKDGAALMEALYEGVGPEGTAFLVEVITDNKNRSVTNIKTIFGKNGGNMGGSGSVAWMFDRKGRLEVEVDAAQEEEAELAMIDAGAEDFNWFEEGILEVLTADSALMEVRSALENSGFKVRQAELVYLAKTPVVLSDEAKIERVLNFIDLLEEDDDVARVHGNFEIDNR